MSKYVTKNKRRNMPLDSSVIVCGSMDEFKKQTNCIIRNPVLFSRTVELAAANGRRDILHFLHARKGCDIFLNEQVALKLAVENGRIDVVRYLHEVGANLLSIEDELVVSAAFNGHVEVLIYLHQNGCDLSACVNLRERLVGEPHLINVLRYINASGLLLMALADAKLVSLVKYNDSGKISQNLCSTDIRGISTLLLSMAAKIGSVKLLTYLNEKGCCLANNSVSILVNAVLSGQKDCVKWVAEHAYLSSDDLAFAIKCASEHGHSHLVLYLQQNLGGSLSKITHKTLQLIALNGYWETFDILTYAGLDGIEHERPVIDAMVKEVFASAPIYHPSKLWVFFNEVNLEQLRRFGVARFKRSVNQNYFNYIPRSLKDKQIVSLIKKFIRHPTLAIFKSSMRTPDRYLLSGNRVSSDQQIFQGSNLSYKNRMMSAVYHGLYRMLVSLLWCDAVRKDKNGLKLQQRLHEPTLGLPIEIWYQNRFISQDLANSIIECNSMLQGMDESLLRVAEIGAGYGRVGDVLLSTRHVKYVVFDIPPSLFIAQWYLENRHPGKTVFRFRHFDNFESIREEFEAADIVLCSINQIELIPEQYFDLVVNISSLHEMKCDQLLHILSQMYRVANKRVYLKQYRNYVNPYDGITVSESVYFVPEGWKIASWLPDTNDSRNFEALITRNQTSVIKNNMEIEPAATVIRAPRPSIAIILANYNDGRFLRTALDAILSQSDPADEIILVDDGSSDSSLSIMLSAKSRHPNVKIIVHEQNFGQHIAIQRGLVEATSDYIVWAAADDLLLPHFIAINRAALRKYPEAGLSFSYLATFKDGESDSILEYTEKNHGVAFDLGHEIQYHSPAHLNERLRTHYLWMSGNTVVVRRSILLNMGGFPRDLKWHGDWFAYYCVALRHGAVSIPKTLALMRERPATYSSSGMSNPVLQKQVLSNMIKILKQPYNLDLFAQFKACPSLLSPFGKEMLFVSMSKLTFWSVGMPLFLWYFGRRLTCWKGRYPQVFHFLSTVRLHFNKF